MRAAISSPDLLPLCPPVRLVGWLASLSLINRVARKAELG